jgi:hypothetical protein
MHHSPPHPRRLRTADTAHGQRHRPRRGWQWVLALLLLTSLFPCGGATCARRKTISEFTPPVVFQEKPSLEQLITQINRNQAIERLSSTSVTLSSPDATGSLTGNLSWRRPMDLRLQAYPGTRLLGNAIDAGSNADAFWLQTQMGGPPTLYYARHDQFEMQLGPRRVLPVSPLWIREALGIVEFDPDLPHEGPIARADGNVEIRSLIPSPRGDYRRVVVVEPTRATLRELWLYDPWGRMVARASQSEHQYYSAIDANLPHRVDLQLQPNEGPVMSLTIRVYSYAINQPSGDETLRYVMPDPTGISVVDLVQANSAGQAAPPPPAALPPHTASVPGTLFNYR